MSALEQLLFIISHIHNGFKVDPKHDFSFLYVSHLSNSTQWIPSVIHLLETYLHSSSVVSLKDEQPVKWVHFLLTQAHPSVLAQSDSMMAKQ